MKKTVSIAAFVLCAVGGALQATDVINQDSKPYTIKVQGEGKLSISNHDIGSGGSMYGLCGYSFCTFEISSDKITADKGDRLTIRNGKFVK